ncbi:hypothetical protein KZX46_01815 (plasmid) [Polymorphobacter sp. PAMC 29334]|nr:hypothetical protein [Polymorphobacter sp. PAMC 29334]QYE33525.1 hypothetical protein KZX46_01815 [Polymorphobacter sp. PAMC 29334]
MLVVAVTAATFLAGCGKQEPSSGPPRNSGRFTGIGVFDAGRLWAKMNIARAKPDAADAGIEDDEHVIVVLDSHTGEVRQCGDHSGYCVEMNPWSGTKGQGMLPAKLTKHASDFAVEDQTTTVETSK